MEFDEQPPSLLEIYYAIGDNRDEQGDDPDYFFNLVQRACQEDQRFVRSLLSSGLTDNELEWFFLDGRRK